MKTTPVIYSLGIALMALKLQAQEFSQDELSRRAINRRAIETVIWGMPAVNYELMLHEMLT